MSLNIKNERTHRLIRELAALEGVSMVTAVTNAVEEKLAKEKAQQGKQGLAAWIEELSRETAAMTDDGRTSTELLDELYDRETGLPK